MGAMTTVLRRTTGAPIQVTEWGHLNKKLHMHSTVSLGLGSAMLLRTSSGSNSTTNRVARNNEVKRGLGLQDVVTGAGETSQIFHKEAMENLP